MPKQITISKVNIKEAIISKDNDNFCVQFVYSILTDQNEEIGTAKRITYKDFSVGEKNKIKQILDLCSDKIKIIEEI